MHHPTNAKSLSFEPARAIHMMTFVVMWAACAWSMAAFAAWPVAVPVALALTYSFSHCVKVAFGFKPGHNKPSRFGHGVAGWALACITIGLSYGAAYRVVFAEQSALHYLKTQRPAVQRQLQQVLSEATGARDAFAAWASDSAAKAAKEAAVGGSCPGKPATGGVRGPIFNFRDAEAAMAKRSSTNLTTSVAALEAALGMVSGDRVGNYRDAARVMGQLNAATGIAEGQLRGGAVRAGLETLDRQLASTIRWVDGQQIDCADISRTDVMLTAKKALASLQALPPLKLLEAPIDLDSPQEVAIRGLLRSANAGIKIFTFGLAGSFAGDELLLNALKDSVVNRETIGLGLVALLELSLVLTTVIAARAGASPAPVDLQAGLARLQESAQAQTGGWGMAQRMLLLPTARGLLNLLFTIGPENDTEDSAPNGSAGTGLSGKVRPVFKTSNHHQVVLEADPNVPVEQLTIAEELLPWLLPYGDKEFVIVPNGRPSRAQVAARALEYADAAKLIGVDVPFKQVEPHRSAAVRLTALLPDARTLHYDVYELARPYAQALRLLALQKKGG